MGSRWVRQQQEAAQDVAGGFQTTVLPWVSFFSGHSKFKLSCPRLSVTEELSALPELPAGSELLIQTPV